MKNLILTLAITSILSSINFAEGTWYSQNSGTSSILQDVFFVDQDYGWITGVNFILHTTNSGDTWVAQQAPPVSIYYVDIYFIDRMNGWACGNEAKIIHTTDGGNTWVNQPNPYTFPNPILYSIYFANADTGWALGGDHGNYPNFINRRVVLYTTNGGNSWDFQYSASNEQPVYCANFISPSEGFAASESGDVMHTSNGGNSWIEMSPVSSYRLYGIYFANSNKGWVSGKYLGVPHVASISKTTDGGITWATQSFGTDEYIQDIYFVDDLNGWAVGGAFGGSGASTILHTTDGGENWSVQPSPTSNALYGVSFSDINNGWAVGFGGTVIGYTNPVPVELTSFNATKNNNDVMLSWQTATETNNSGFKILRSIQNENLEWKQIGFVEGNGTTTSESNYLFTDKNVLQGNYYYKLSQVDFDGTRTESEIVEVEINSQPNEYSLLQNYPNPFNPSTTIKYSIPESGNVSLAIYNSIGEKVETLVNDFKSPGNYEINFNASKLASGIYYYQLRSGVFTQTKKMILMK